MIKNYLIIIFLIVVCLKINAQTFEESRIYLVETASCQGQSHYELKINYINNNFIDLLQVKWKKDGKVINSKTKFGLLVKESGLYNCELWYLDKYITSDTIKFGENTFVGKPQFEFSSVGNYNYTDCGKILQSMSAPFDTNIWAAKYDWYINDQIQENHASKFIIPKDIKSNKYKVKGIIRYEDCLFQTPQTELFTNPIAVDFSGKTINYELCLDDSIKVSRLNKTFYKNCCPYFYAKFDWYKDGQLIETKNWTPTENYVDFLKITEPGTYNVVTTLPEVYHQNNFEKNTCVVRSENIVVTKKDTITLDKSRVLFRKNYCIDEPTFNYSLRDKGVKSFEWFRNDTLLTENNSYISEKFSLNYTDYFGKVKAKGNYSAQILYENGCLVKTPKEYYPGKPKFVLNVSKNCDKAVLTFDFNNYTSNFSLSNWWFNGIKIPNYFLNSIEINKSGKYKVSNYIGYSCPIESEEITIDFEKDFPAKISGDSTFCIGKKTELKFENAEDSKILDWYENGVSMKNSEPNVLANKTGNYRVLLSSEDCNNIYYSTSKNVTQIPLPTASISGNKAIEFGEKTDLKLELTSTQPWSVKLNTGEEISVQKSPFLYAVKPLTDTKYSIKSIENICGLGTSTGEAEIKVIILANEPDLNENVDLKTYPIPVKNVFTVEVKNMGAKTKPIEIFLFDILGKIVSKSKAEIIINSHIKTLDINHLQAGLYILKVNIDGKIIERKILKE